MTLEVNISSEKEDELIKMIKELGGEVKEHKNLLSCVFSDRLDACMEDASEDFTPSEKARLSVLLQENSPQREELVKELEERVKEEIDLSIGDFVYGIAFTVVYESRQVSS